MVVAGLTFGLVEYVNPEGLAPASPLLIACMLSPFAAMRLSAPVIPRKDRLSTRDRRLLREFALRTWQFFADFECASGVGGFRVHQPRPDVAEHGPPFRHDAEDATGARPLSELV